MNKGGGGVLYIVKQKRKTPTQTKQSRPDRDTDTTKQQKRLLTRSNWSNFKVTEKQSGCGVTHHITSRCRVDESVAAEQSVYCQAPHEGTITEKPLRSLWSDTFFNIFQKGHTLIQQTTSDIFLWDSTTSLWVIAKGLELAAAEEGNYGGAGVCSLEGVYFRKDLRQLCRQIGHVSGLRSNAS